MTVQVRQYKRPDGNVEMFETDISDAFQAPYDAITSRGWRLAAEVLISGLVSITVEDDEQDFACEIVLNGPDVQRAIERAIATAISAQPEEERE